MPLLLAVLLLILAEISLFVVVGGAIGLLPTLAVVLGTGVLGGIVLRSQGQKTISQMAGRVMEPRALASAGDGVLVAIAGILLVLPGFLTDVAGLVLLVPLVRRAVLRRLAKGLRHGSGGVSMHVVMGADRVQDPRRPAAFDSMGTGDIIDGEVLDPPPDSTHPGRPRR